MIIMYCVHISVLNFDAPLHTEVAVWKLPSQSSVRINGHIKHSGQESVKASGAQYCFMVYLYFKAWFNYPESEEFIAFLPLRTPTHHFPPLKYGWETKDGAGQDKVLS